MLFFHGTTVEAAETILSEGRFLASKNRYDWLGPGAYFFQDAPLLALAWALEKARDVNSEPAVVQVKIDLQNCFDLLRNDHSKLLAAHRRQTVLPPEYGHHIQRSPILRDHELVPHQVFNGIVSEDRAQKSGYNLVDCMSIRSLLAYLNCEENKSYNCVRSVFWAGAEIYKGSYFYDHSHVQLCVLAHEETSSENQHPYVLLDRKPLNKDVSLVTFGAEPIELVKRYVRMPR